MGPPDCSILASRLFVLRADKRLPIFMKPSDRRNRQSVSNRDGFNPRFSLATIPLMAGLP